jgi:non-ribosomal peptide synthetase component F
MVPELPYNYGDYIHTESAMLAGEDGERHWDYWRRQLSGELPRLSLPGAHARTDRPSYRGSSHEFRVDRATTQRIRELSAATGATLYTTLLAAFVMHLRAVTGQGDVIVGSPVTARVRPEWLNIVGYFDNLVAMRIDLAGDLTFAQVITKTRAAVLGAMDHRAYPFATLVQRLRPRRDSSRSPLFDVVFVFRRAHLPEMEEIAAFSMGHGGASIGFDDEVQMEPVHLPRGVSQFDLTLAITEFDGEFLGSIEYSTDIFDAATIDDLASDFCELLATASANPDGEP